jgi:MFS family permease
MSKVLPNFERKNLIFYTSVLPFLGHLIILSLPNCEEETLSTGKKFILGSGFFVFGSGIGVYYSVSFPAVGMAVP